MESKKRKMVDDGKEFEAMEGVTGGENQEAGVKEPDVRSRKQEDLYIVHAEQFRSIFPEETWLSILNKLDRDDQDNCANASPYFWELLQKQRTLFLFPKVIDIMALIFEQNYDICKVSTAERDMDGSRSVEPLTMAGTMNNSLDSEKWKKMVLRCRLVCSTWNTAVENFYQKPLMTGIPEFVDELDPRSKLANLGNIYWAKSRVFIRPQALRQFREHFEEILYSGVGVPPKLKNPLFGRYLVIRIGLSPPAYENNLKEIIKKIGKEIWYLEVMLVGNQLKADQNLQIFINLRSYLSLVPNLKFLQIHSQDPIAHASSQSGRHPDVNICSPLPTLEKLEILSVKNLAPQIASELIRKNAHVAYLKISQMDFDQDLENSLEMPNLQGFSVVRSPFGEKMLENSGPIWKNVKKLCFEVGYERKRYPSGRSVPPTVGIGAPEASSIFQNNWAETLTDLQLEYAFGLDEDTIMEQSRTLRLNLHVVRRLTLRDIPCVFLDFALPLKNCLEHLVLQINFRRPGVQEYRQKVEREQTIQLAGFEDKLEMSNIWMIFVKLETIKMENVWNWRHNFTLFTNEKKKFDYSRKRGLYA